MKEYIPMVLLLVLCLFADGLMDMGMAVFAAASVAVLGAWAVMER